MIVWINGAFGSGKSSVAGAVCDKLSKAHIYDPEQVGYFLWDNFPEEMKRTGNFQHIPLWREINRKILRYMAEQYDGILIVPMTLYIKQYYDEIIGCLTDEGVAVRHFILTATKQTILDRLVKRGDTENGWAAQHIDVCMDAFETKLTGVRVDTDGRRVNEIADEIIRSAGLGEMRGSQ